MSNEHLTPKEQPPIPGREDSLDGPFLLSLEFIMTDGDRAARVIFELNPGTVPPREQVELAAARARKAIREVEGSDKFRFATRTEFCNLLIGDPINGNFVPPGPTGWALDLDIRLN